jgi:hypothetical protein
VITSIDLRPAAEHWLMALDAAGCALTAAQPVLPAEGLHARWRELVAERHLAAEQLVELARETRSAASLSTISELLDGGLRGP